MTELADRRLLLVHAHPDDESINNGATMATYAAQGAHVALVTCTLGEEGEVIPPALAHLAADRDDLLGAHRAEELAAAMKELGVTDHRFLGGPGRFRDSGMMGTAQNHRAGAFWAADVDDAAAPLVEVIRELRPQVLVTYDPDGGYGHPDHIQAHRVAMRAADLAADPAFRTDPGAPHTIAKIYWNRVPRSVGEHLFRRLGEAAGVPWAAAALDDVPGVVDDARVTTEIDGRPQVARKAAAMRAHGTQIAVEEPWFALSNDLAQPLFDIEYYELVRGRSGAAPGERESDLFAGLPSGTGADTGADAAPAATASGTATASGSAPGTGTTEDDGGTVTST